MSNILSRCLLFMWLINILHTTSLLNENCNSDRYNEGEGSDNKDACDGARKTEQPSLKYTEMEGANEWMSLPANEKQLYDLFRSGKRHPAMEMADAAMKIKRSPNQVFLLLVGLSGSGKSSTVNYLFETNIARTSDSRSETHSTTEYTLQMKSNEWRIPDLTLSLIDTPGYGDTGGFAQDARNIMSIRYFLNSHPNLTQNNYPNLVMIIQSINDNRMEGESSSFAKMLKGLSQIDTIDHYNPNVVIVLTHATSIARNPKIWEERVKKKKEEVRAIVRLYLGIKPEIVVQENLPEENDLERDGDWYLLPNRDKQPKILYQACKRILDRAGDKLGHEAVAVGFRHGINKTVLKGFSILSSEVTSKDADKMHTILIQSIEQLPSSSEVGTMLENYKKKKNMTDLDNDILILQVKFRDLHISNTSDLQTMTMNQLMSKFHPLKITSEIQKILGDVFGLHYKQVEGIDYHVGKGYNIFTDTVTLKSPLVMEEHSDQYGLPINVQLNECSVFKIIFDSVKDIKEYISERLRELHINIGGLINFKAFNIKLRSGYSKESSKIKTFAVEHRNRKVTVTQPFQINIEFKDAVRALPEDNDLTNEINVMKWKAFFDKWGMYVVTDAYIGGSLTGRIKIEDGQSFEDSQIDLETKFSFLMRDEETYYSNTDKDSSFRKGSSAVHSMSLEWNGGNTKTYKTALDKIEQSDWKAWIESLEYSPVPLWNSLDLYPIYHIASEISEQKGIMMQKAMSIALIDEFNYQIPNAEEDNRENTGKSNKAGYCFHEDSVIVLHDGKEKQMKDLTVGDRVFVLDDKGNLMQDEMIAWLHLLRTGIFKFLKITHEFGEIKLTPDHVIFVGENRSPQHASTISPGDKLSFLMTTQDRKTVYMTTVLSIQTVNGTGVYAPLTYNGRLLVDNVDVSCYSTLDHLQVMGQDVMSSHALAHLAFFPLRMAFTFGLDINDNEYDDGTGIHGYAKWLLELYWT